MNIRPPALRPALTGLWIVLFAGALVFAASLQAQTTPTLTLVSPANGTAVDGPVTVRVEHSGIIFDGTKIGMAPEPGVGHWHINIDGKYAGLAVSNVVEIPNDAFPTISAGQHTIMVNLHENNHALTTPPVEQSFPIDLNADLNLGVSVSGAPVAATTMATGTVAHLPNTGGESDSWALPTSIMATCMLVGGLFVYRNRARRNHAS